MAGTLKKLALKGATFRIVAKYASGDDLESTTKSNVVWFAVNR